MKEGRMAPALPTIPQQQHIPEPNNPSRWGNSSAGPRRCRARDPEISEPQHTTSQLASVPCTEAGLGLTMQPETNQEMCQIRLFEDKHDLELYAILIKALCALSSAFLDSLKAFFKCNSTVK